MSDLDKLIEAVEAGVTIHVHTGLHAIRGIENRMSLLDAYSGSLDAAKVLHDALLDRFMEGWEVDIIISSDSNVMVSKSFNKFSYHAKSHITSRAWLIAILKAYRSTIGEKA